MHLMHLRCTALAFALSLVPAVASAQLSDADKATARSLAQQGQEALDRKDFTTAADRFDRARQLVPAPTLTLGLARAQVGLGRWVAAQETYNRLLREGAPAGAPPAFAKALAEARKELDALEPRIPSVVINVSGAPAAKVTLDDAPVPSAALGVRRPVDPGRHVVHAEADGFAPAESAVTVAEHRTETVTLALARGQAAPPPPVAVPVPPPPPPGPPPPVGARLVAVVPVPVGPEPPPSSGGSTRKTVGFVGIGVGAAALVMGGVTGGLAIGKHSTLASTCLNGHCPSGEFSTLDSYHLLSDLSTAGFVAGGVLAVAGVVLVVTAPRGRPSGDAWVAPVVGPGFVGAQGRF